MGHDEIVFLIVISARKLKENLIKELMLLSAKCIETVYGHGTSNNKLLETLGLEVEKNKVIITCLVRRQNSESIISMLNTKFKFNEHNTGIAFTIPVEKIKY